MFNQPCFIKLIEHELSVLYNRLFREERYFGHTFTPDVLRVLLTAPDGHAVVRVRDAH
jgi:hypothetical protein